MPNGEDVHPAPNRLQTPETRSPGSRLCTALAINKTLYGAKDCIATKQPVLAATFARAWVGDDGHGSGGAVMTAAGLIYDMSKVTVHWFPSHMRAGIDRIRNLLKRCDLILEVRDARI